MVTTRDENRNWISVAALFGASAVILGAFGSHGLRHQIGPEALAIWRTGVEYQLVHALAILSVSAIGSEATRAIWSLRCWSLGIVLFSGSLYLLAVTGLRFLGVLTPLGGVSFIAGWLALAWRAKKWTP